ncbi:hypothetical protein [Microvirga sp. M2]|uniref:hypothetical protein n=1 Tax=Microvirga sp. M2 TaxID=3073270 RepID=UPI0039C403B9
MCGEYGYTGSLRSVQRYWRHAYPAPVIRARRRVETPPGAQAQVDWAHFPGIIIAGIPTDLLALHMVLSFSRKQAIVWSPAKDMLAWLAAIRPALPAWAACRRPCASITRRPRSRAGLAPGA